VTSFRQVDANRRNASARCDVISGTKIDKKHQRNKRAEARWLGRQRRAKRKQLGNADSE
jgi:hypothetical protein